MESWRSMTDGVQILLVSDISRDSLYSYWHTLGFWEFIKMFNWVYLAYFYGHPGFLSLPLVSL